MKPNFVTRAIILRREKIIAISQKSLNCNLKNVKYFQTLLKEQKEDLECFKKCLGSKYQKSSNLIEVLSGFYK